jgi:Amt family ammonium transporter
MMVSSALVLLMVPGLGLFYSGVSEKSSALSMMWLSMMTTSLIGVQVCSLSVNAISCS